MPNAGATQYAYVKEKTGKDHPTLTVFGNESQSGKNAVKFQSIAYKGAGYDVVSQQTKMPLPPVPDFTPYAQDILTSNNGGPPDVVLCLLSGVPQHLGSRQGERLQRHLHQLAVLEHPHQGARRQSGERAERPE